MTDEARPSRQLHDTSYHARHAVAGDSRSIEWLVERLTPLLLMQAECRIGPALRRFCEPEDLVADVWAIALPRLQSIRPRENHYARVLVKYLSTILLHRTLDLAKSRLRQAAVPMEGDDPFAALPDHASGVVSRVLRTERKGTVWQCLEQLTDDERRLVVMRGIEQRPQKEAAAVLGITPGAVAVRYHRAISRLREKLPDSVFAELESAS